MAHQQLSSYDAALTKIKDIVGEGGWKHGVDTARYCADPRGRFTGQAPCVVLPKSTQEVSCIVQVCHEHDVALIPYGGGSGVVAGQLSLTSDHIVILSLERMNKIIEISQDGYSATVEAGCILEHIHEAVGELGLEFPLNMASKGSCSIGGNLATNAGGIQVLRYGNARDLCLGIEAVLPDGSILSELRPLHKDNTSYDLKHLLIGSEGTLGIITAATLKLVPRDPEVATMMCVVTSPKAALTLYNSLRRSLRDSMCAFELMSGLGMELVTHHFPNLRRPFDQKAQWYALIEASGAQGISEVMMTAMAECLEQDLAQDAIFAQSEQQRAQLWALRENTPEANRKEGALVSSDTSVPIGKVQEFIDDTHRAISAEYPTLRVNTYGHIGDGNIHHNVLPPLGQSKSQFLELDPRAMERLRMIINDVTVQYGGSISGEHGIGRLKSEDLASYASSAKYRALRQIKAALDPKNIMNPGAVFPAP